MRMPTRRKWRTSRSQVYKYSLLLPMVVFLVMFLVIPYATLVVTSFRPPLGAGRIGAGFTFLNYQKALTDTYYLHVLGRTLVYALVATAACLLLGYPLAYHLAKPETKHKGILYAIILSPLLVGAVIRCYGWMLMLADKGLINSILAYLGFGRVKLMYNAFGVLVGLTHIYLPFMVLSLIGPIQSVDPAWKHAARTLGASGSKTFLRITLPLSLPGVLSGSILVFLLASSSYIGPILLGGYGVTLTPMLIVQTILSAVNYPFGAALSFVLVACIAGVVIVLFQISDRLLKGVDVLE